MAYIPLEVYTNNATGTVSSGGTAAPSPGTVETWTVNASAAFPACALNATQFHVADPAQPSETFLVSVAPGGTGSQTWTVVRGAEGSTPVAHTTGFTVVQVVTGGAIAALQYFAWQFPVSKYGAKGDGLQFADGVMANGSAVLTSATAPWTAADVNKVIIVNIGAAGAQVNPLCTTITAYNGPGSVTLGATCTVTGTTAAPFIYGTDDSTAINAAVTAAAAFGAAYNQKAQVLFEPLNYMLAALTQTTSPYVYNTHIPIPFAGQYAEKLILDFIGVGDASEPDYWESSVPSLSGTCLVSASFMTSVSGTYGQQSIIGGPTSYTGLSPGLFANVLVNIVGITVIAPFNAGQMGYDFRYLGQANLPNASYLAFAAVNYSAQAVSGPVLGYGSAGALLVTNGLSVGCYFPLSGNNDNNNFGFFTCEGAAFGVAIAEHATAQRLALIYCATCIYVACSGTMHGGSILYASCEASGTALVSGGGSGNQYPIFIGQLDCEVMTAHITDTNNTLTGVVNWADIGVTAPVVSGAAALNIVNTRLPPGPWPGAPAAPASGAAQHNTSYRPAFIKVTSTAAITATATGPASGSLTSVTESVATGSAAALYVPSGHWYSVTSAGGTLTAKWVLG